MEYIGGIFRNSRNVSYLKINRNLRLKCQTVLTSALRQIRLISPIATVFLYVLGNMVADSSQK